MTSAPRAHPRPSQGRRAPELATLLLELLRVVKARRLCSPGDAQLVTAFGRAARAWQTDLGRHGALDLHLGNEGFRPAEGGAALSHPRLEELLRLLAERGIYRICFTAELDADGLAGFVEALAADAGLRRGDGGFAASLYARVPCGIVVNDAGPGEEDTSGPGAEVHGDDPAEAVPAAVFEDAATAPSATTNGQPAATSAQAAGDPVVPPASLFGDPAAPSAPPVDDPSASLVGATSAPLADAPAHPLANEEPAARSIPLADESVPPVAEVGEPALAAAPAPPEGTELAQIAEAPALDLSMDADESTEASTLPLASDGNVAPRPVAAPPAPSLFDAPSEDPGSAPDQPGANDAAGAAEEGVDADTLPVHEPVPVPDADPPLPEGDPDDELAAETRQLIADLRACSQTSAYMDLARRTGFLAERTSELERDDLSDLLLQALAEDAQGKLEERERDAARSFLGSAMQGRRLGHLIERIARSDGSERIGASQLVLSLGEDVIPTLLQAANQETDRVARDRIHSVLIAMGERLLPEIQRMLQSEEPAEVMSALRLAGETQHPAVVPRLADFLADGSTEQREEAARSLVRVGGDDAILALARAVRSEAPGVAVMAIQGLGSTGSHRAAGPLRHALDRALDDKAVNLAKEVVRALGRLGQPEVAAPLAAVLQRKARFGGRWLKELKVAAAAALGGIPGDEAVGALAQAAHSKDAQLRRAAQMALDRRAQSLAREGRGRGGDSASRRGPVR